MKRIPTTAFDEVLVANLTPIFQSSFESTVSNTDISINSTSAGGTVTQADAMAVLATSTTTASTAKLLSKRHAKYKSGFGANTRFTALFSAPIVGTDQLIGIADTEGTTSQFKNGLMVGYINGVFGFHRFTNDVTTSIPLTEWADPLDGTGDSRGVLDPTKLNIFFIRYGYLGIANPTLFWMAPNGEMKLVCEMRLAGTLSNPHSYNPNYFFTMFVDNKATTSNVTLKCASFAYFVEGNTSMQELQQIHKSSGEIQKTTVTTETAIFTIRNKTTYTSLSNYVDVLLQMVSASIESSSANNLGGIRLVSNTTLGGTPSWSDINTTNSVIELDTAGTTLTGGETLITFPLAGKNDAHVFNSGEFNLLMAPGDSITLAALSANSSTIRASCFWKELF